ncbi:MAG: peptidoglycan binding domain-containing protein [Atopococcus tabaci]|uniref:Peptidoglycan binding domain-containing protein n=1 Tax=Atopococcus tabaci TaxID=269774 RepID=A0AA43UDG9_9LACT|nr:peptidoglycan binding domain-containing protein [Atopococcus tabaci]
MKKSTKTSLFILIFILLAFITTYFIGQSYFNNRFYLNTSVGTVDVSSMTVEEAQSVLEDNLLQSELLFTENNEELGRIPLGNFSTVSNVDDIINDSFQDQQKNNWLTSIAGSTQLNSSLNENLEIDSQKLQEGLEGIGIDNSQREASKNADMHYQEGEGYVVVEEVQGTQIDVDKIKELIQQDTTIELSQAYTKADILSDDEGLSESINQANQILQTKITLTMEDNEVTIPEKEISQWIQLNDLNSITLNQDEIYDYLGELNLEYATYAKDRTLQSTYSGEVTVPQKILGWYINREAETEQITNELKAGQDVTRDPIIEGNNYGIGLDFGPDYVEVDISQQKLMIYLDNEKVFETDVITGRPGSETPVGASYVWYKDTHQTLMGFNVHTGENYETPVNYWVAVTDDNLIGLHDASWQYDFGGDSYLSHGSLGCINIDPSVMSQVYNSVYEGMPVAVF